MSTLKNCSRCGRLYNGLGRLCLGCIEEEEQQLQIVQETVRNHPDQDLQGIAELTGVSVRQIMNFVRQGRLEILPQTGAQLLVRCSSCGKTISSGRYCNECAARLMRGLQQGTGKKSSGWVYHTRKPWEHD